jgi:hippurate hydrolase
MSDLKSEFFGQLRDWRRHLHANPEFGFEEIQTSKFVVSKLREFGITEIAEGIGGTGVVATIRCGNGNRSIALRADMDALRIEEHSDLDYRSGTKGIMHACGHDGHTTMLLGAAKILAQEGGFDGTVRLIFQPAEEWGRGALAMIEGGLLQSHPFDEIYGIHNMPGMPINSFATRAGPIMAAEDIFEITLKGRGGHAARPHQTNEVLVAACALVTDMQTIVSRRIDPADQAVVSVTELVTDGTRNALPGTARILGDARSMTLEVSAEIERRMRQIAEGIALAYDCAVSVEYQREFIPLVNTALETAASVEVADKVFGKSAVERNCGLIMASEDFAQFLRYAPGSFAFIGNGTNSMPLHNASYDFNDNVLEGAISYLVELARARLSISP